MPSIRKLFHRKKASSDQASATSPTTENPYAQSPTSPSDPYAPRTELPPSPQNASPRGEAPGPTNSGYGPDSYGASGGYGSNRFDEYSPRRNSRGPGGYGGLGDPDGFGSGAAPVSGDESRNALFGGAKERYLQEKQQQQDDEATQGTPPPRYGDIYRGNGQDGTRDELFGGARDRYEQNQAQNNQIAGRHNEDDADAYGGYGASRELTAEEQEEQEIDDVKQRIKEIKQESAASTNRSVAAGQAALEASRSTMARLGAQGDRLHNTEKNLDLSINHNKVAQEQTAKLKSLNRSMFAVHVNNPFGAKARQEEREQELLERHRQERAAREETRHLGLQANNRVEQALKRMSLGDEPKPKFQRDLLARQKYQFEADDEDDELEETIEDNVAQLEGITKNLHQAGVAIGRELDEQNRLVGRIGVKSDIVDDQVKLNRDRLGRVR